MRKTICVCVSGYDWECESRIVQGIFKKSIENNYNCLVFGSQISKAGVKHLGLDNTYIIKGESEIFNLINYNLIDGLIFSGTIVSDDATLKIIKNCNKYKIPVISVNSKINEVEYSISVEAESAFFKLIEHLIVDHNCRKLNFIAGFPSEDISDRRLLAYKSVLEKYNIPIEENRIGYGYFWDSAVDVVKKFIEDDIFPEAIICANDSMAIFVMDFLKNQGYRIPDDVIVIGYDGYGDGEKYDIPLSSVRHNFIASGEKAVEEIIDLINGKEVEKDVIISGEILIRKSCGCNKENAKTSDFFNDMNYNDLNNYKRFNEDIITMNRKAIAANSSMALFNSLIQGAELFYFTRLYMCINYEYEKIQTDLIEQNGSEKYGLSDKMILMSQRGSNVKIGTKFPTEQMLPEEFLQQEYPVFMSFIPMYFKDKYLGYVAFEPWKVKGKAELFSLWLMEAANQVGSFYTKMELENLYMTDFLTGFYNRRGMEIKFNSIYKKVKEENRYCSIICIDIDNLKIINDKFGHEEGDNAINVASKAIKEGFGSKSIFVRTGGDEFCVMKHSSKKIDEEDCIKKINEYLDNYNANSNLEYKVLCSCGYIQQRGSDIAQISELRAIADENMYKEKTRRKSMLKNI